MSVRQELQEARARAIEGSPGDAFPPVAEEATFHAWRHLISALLESGYSYEDLREALADEADVADEDA